jgi:hypothetical protein
VARSKGNRGLSYPFTLIPFTFNLIYTFKTEQWEVHIHASTFSVLRAPFSVNEERGTRSTEHVI